MTSSSSIPEEQFFAHAVQLLASLADTAALQLPAEVVSSGQAAAATATAEVKTCSGDGLGPLTEYLQQTLQFLAAWAGAAACAVHIRLDNHSAHHHCEDSHPAPHRTAGAPRS